MKSLRFLISTIIGSFVNPVVIVSLFGPMIQYVNIVLLQYRLGLTSPSSLSQLKILLDDLWMHAILTFNIQMFTLLLAWIFIFVEFARVINPYLRKYNLDEIKSLTNNSLATQFMLLTILVLLFGGVASFLMGIFADPNLISLYLPSETTWVGSLSFPPLKSSITIARGVIILQGIYFSYWERKVLPTMVQGLDKDNVQKS